MTVEDACPHCGDTDLNNRWGHEIRGVYDGVLFWTCGKCQHAWPRLFHHGPVALASQNAAYEWNRVH